MEGWREGGRDGGMEGEGLPVLMIAERTSDIKLLMKWS